MDSYMKYISGIQDLNIPCSLLSCGDWHQSSINWNYLDIYNSKDSIYKEYGIEICDYVPYNPGSFYVANHIRALLDLLVQGNFGLAQGMNKDFICNDDYTDEIFQKVAILKILPIWSKIDSFMGYEYYAKWLRFKEKWNY
jgi:hypothetical protein